MLSVALLNRLFTPLRYRNRSYGPQGVMDG